MAGGCIFVEEMPAVTLDASGAKLAYRSGGEYYERRYPRSLWRRFLEREIRRLNAFEAEERASVVELRRDHG